MSRPVNASQVVALEWLPVELLLALGVAPYGVADIASYRQWVGEPALPPHTVEVGLRTEPNLELLAEMRPSLILFSPGTGPTADMLERIAPVMPVSFSDDGQPLASARQSLQALGRRLGLQAQATAHLTEFDSFIASMRARLAPYRGRPLLLMTFLDARHVMVIGRNSLFQQVLDLLGLQNGWQGEVSFWGSTIVEVERLAGVASRDVICFKHGDDAMMHRATRTPLWQAMPFIRHGHFHIAPQVWFYGATLSAVRFCHILEATLGARR